MRYFQTEQFSRFLPAPYPSHVNLAAAKHCRWVQSSVMAALLNSLSFAFANSFLPKYRAKYYDYIVKWCSGRGLCIEPSSRPQDGCLRSRTGGVYRYPSTGRRRQTGRPNARPRTGCITRRTYVLRIILLRLVYYCASVGADFYSFSYRTSCDLVARDQNLSPLAQPGFWR